MTTLAEQIATLESKLAAYESRNVPLSGSELRKAYNAEPFYSFDEALTRVARAALVAAESPAAVEDALAVWRQSYSGPREAMLATIRAAHDAAIDGGCGAARESDEVTKLRAHVADFSMRLDTTCEQLQIVTLERDDAWRDLEVLKANANAHRAEVVCIYKERDDLRRQLDDALKTVNMQRVDLISVRDRLDALTRPIDGAEELGRIGWEAWQRAIDCPPRPHVTERNVAADGASAQAIASHVIGALRSGLAGMCGGDANPVRHKFAADCVEAFDDAVASLKIEPAKVETPPVDTRPVVKVGQVWQYNGNDIVSVADIRDWKAFDASGKTAFGIADDGRPMARGWRLLSDTPTPKREPFELPAIDDMSSRNEIALRNKVREIERRLEAGGL